MERILAACGNDCSACPRYSAHPYEKSEEELHHTAELWLKIGYRDHVVSNEEITCNGCKPENWCRYRVVRCCEEKGIKACSFCLEYPCENIKECFDVTASFEPKCRQVCSDAEYTVMKKAFFDKELNLLTDQAITYINDLFRDNAGGHDIEHTLRVYRNAMLIAESEPECDRKIVSLAALLHDADDHKLFHTENNENARLFLYGRVSAEQTEKICSCINSVSFSRNQGKAPDTLEGKIVQDADRLDAMGAIGIARTFAFGGEHGRPLQESVKHFHDKLLLLRDMMNTETARELSIKRHAFLESFLKELDEETITGGLLLGYPDSGMPERKPLER